MKTLKLLIASFAIAAVTFGSVMAGGNSLGQRVDNPADLKNRIESFIHIPIPQDGQQSGAVEMLVRINAEGRLEILKIEGDHTYMVDQVRQDVNDQRVNAAETIQGKVYRMVLHYANGTN